MLDQIFWVGLLASTLRLATPIMFAALGETVAQRAGVLNVGLEGIMLVGAFLAVLGSYWTGSPVGGLVLAILGGVALAGLHGFLSISLKVDQIVSGIALLVLGLGLSGYWFRLSLGGMSPPPSIVGFTPIDLPWLSGLPVVGPVLFQHHMLVYFGIGMAFAIHWFLFYTTWGLEVRAIGENPAAGHAVGVRVQATRYGCVLFGGAMAAIGGAFLATAQLNGFVENMVSGRGFIAIACVVFGRWTPLGTLLAVLLFGAADAAQIRIQTLGTDIPFQFLVMMPYVLALVLLVVFAGRSRMPAALGEAFDPLK